MTIMTTGQRIAAKRKEQGLSQENLGEQLGVSRQAIYKWESDASLPDIDKLIALSRLFGVSVGWLLGVEEAPEKPEETLTDRQAELIEDIFRKYQQPQEREPVSPPPPRRMSRKQKYLLAGGCAAAVVLVCSLGAALNSRLSALDAQYRDLSYSVSHIYDNVGTRISTLTDSISAMLEKQNSLLDDFSTEVTSADVPAGTVTFSLTAVPKSYTSQTSAVFRYTSEGQDAIEVEGVRADGGRFTAELTGPLVDAVTLSVTLIDGDERQVQTLGYYSSLYSDSLPDVELWGDEDMAQFTGGDLFTVPEGSNARVYVHQQNFTEGGPLPTAQIRELKAGLFLNQKLVTWLDPADPEDRMTTNLYEFFIPPLALTLEEGDILTLAAVVTDEYDRTCVWPSGFSSQYKDGQMVILDGEYSATVTAANILGPATGFQF